MTESDSVRLTALVTGRVQGVGFRAWVRERALPLGLVGRATNLPDGRVEVVAQGRRSAAEMLLDALRGADTPGRVTDVMPFWAPPSDAVRPHDAPPGFRIG